MTRLPPTSTPFPYTTLFRSHLDEREAPGPARRRVAHHTHRFHGAGLAEQLLEFRFTRGIRQVPDVDRKSTRLNSSHPSISYAVFCLKKKINAIYQQVA